MQTELIPFVVRIGEIQEQDNVFTDEISLDITVTNASNKLIIISK